LSIKLRVTGDGRTEPVPRNACNVGLLQNGEGERGLIKGESSCTASAKWASVSVFPLEGTCLGICEVLGAAATGQRLSVSLRGKGTLTVTFSLIRRLFGLAFATQTEHAPVLSAGFRRTW
jgi:hypothetical protein